MKFICPDCGFDSENPGNCPTCETPLLKREDEGLSEVEDIKEEAEDLDEEADEEWEEEEDEGELGEEW